MTTAMQRANLEREIQRLKESARQALTEAKTEDARRDILVDAFWHTRTRSQIMAYHEPAATAEYTVPLPEFEEFVRELTQDVSA